MRAQKSAKNALKTRVNDAKNQLTSLMLKEIGKKTTSPPGISPFGVSFSAVEIAFLGHATA
jgi:hypothetical protein